MWLQKIKRQPRRTLTWPCYLADVDHRGVWLYVPPGSLCRGVDGERVLTSQVAMDTGGRGRPRVCLVPPSAWWVAHWTWTVEGPRIDIDMCIPPRRHPWGWSFQDLELDPFRDPSGVVGVDDRDEFDGAVRAGTIDPREAATVEQQARDVTRALTGRHEPFGNSGSEHLTRLADLELAPLRDLDAAPA